MPADRLHRRVAAKQLLDLVARIALERHARTGDDADRERPRVVPRLSGRDEPVAAGSEHARPAQPTVRLEDEVVVGDVREVVPVLVPQLESPQRLRALAVVGELRAGDFAYVEQEIRAIREATGKNILKVIIETCLLTEEEKIAMCRIVTAAGADFIKTSTGFSTGGATLADIELFRAHVGPDVRIKAAGGISTLDDAKAFLAAGASRLGTSRVVKIIRDGQAVQSGY